MSGAGGEEGFRGGVRALLMTPLMSPSNEQFAAVRRHGEALREWFMRETGWVLQVDRDGARLFKRPGDLSDATRGLPGYDRRRYVLLCLACAVLDRADPQITLRLLGERLLEFAADPALDFTFTLETQYQRRELVCVCRTLLELGVLRLVVGNEELFVQATGSEADALYDVQRRILAGVLAAVRGPSTWTGGEAPVTISARLHALTDDHREESDEGRRMALRHRLARRLLDDPVVYTDTLDPVAHAYFVNQRGPMAARLCEATGLVPEHRAEGLALVDERGLLTDVAMPAEGTDAHVTLLAAEYLAGNQREGQFVREHDIVDFLHGAKSVYGRYWRASAREPGAERALADIALEQLEKLHLVTRADGGVYTRPALARFALGEAEIRTGRQPATHAPGSLFGPAWTTT